MLPVGKNIPVLVRHFDLRQILSVEDLVFRDNSVFRQQVSRNRIDLVRFQRTFLSERHTAIDVVPDNRRVWRVKRHYIVPSDTGLQARRQLHRGVSLYQLRSAPFVSAFTVACRTLLGKEFPALLRASASLRKFLSIGTDRDIPGANFFRRWSVSQPIGRRLCPYNQAQSQCHHQRNHSQGKLTQFHWSHSRPQRSSTAQWCYPYLEYHGHGSSRSEEHTS